MVPCCVPSSCPPFEASVKREGLGQQLSRSGLSPSRQCGCSLAIVIFVLLQLEIVIVPLGAAHYSNNFHGYILRGSQQRHQIWKRSITSLTSYEDGENGRRTGTSNGTLWGDEVVIGEWKNFDSGADGRLEYKGQQFVLFAFTVVRNGKAEHFSTPSSRFHVIKLEPHETVSIKCHASLLGLGEDMDVEWWKDGAVVPTANSTLLVLSDRNLGLYRCLADVAVVSVDLLDSYLVNSRVKRSAEMPPGKVLSNAVIVKRTVSLHFIVHPKNITVAIGSVFRMECVTNGSLSEPIVWSKNGTEITENNTEDNVYVYTIEHHSVLHFLGVDSNDSGHYRCHSGAVSSDVAVVTVTRNKDANSTKNALLKELPSELSVPTGGSMILECLDGDPHASLSWHIVNEYGQPIRKYQTGNGESYSAIVIRSATAQDNGKYTCGVSRKTARLTTSTFVTVQVAPLLLVERSVRRITGTLGTTTRLRCSASVEPHDTSFRITWYKDGKRVVSFGRAKLQPAEGFASEIVVNEMGISMVEFTKDLLLSNVQQTDQGLYQCIASNAVGERSLFIGLIVEAEIDSAITNLKVTVDHKNAQFDLKWQLPQRMDYLDAQRSVFLLNYYLSDGGSANNVPLRNAHCTVDNWCVAKCCASNYVFFARRNYTFQMSLLKLGTVGRITPLSEHVTAVSWDGVSQRALDLTIGRPDMLSLSLSWSHPSVDVANGIVQKYTIEYYRDVGPVQEVKRRDILPNSTLYILNGVVLGMTYRFRVIPVTRHGLPSSVNLKSNANYTFIGYVVDPLFGKFRSEIGSVVFDIVQEGSSITVEWKDSKENSNYAKQDAENQAVLIRYARSDVSPLKENSEEGLFVNGAMNLSATFETSRTYQFCSRLYDGVLHGPDFCRTYRLLAAPFNDMFGGISFDSGLPRPVWCDHLERKDCRCEPSYEFGDAMRVTWDWPEDGYSADEFVVHYTLSDIIHEDDRLVITDEAFADLPNLRSNTTYRIMVEARNKMGGVEGSWFNCTTPALKQIPAPTGVTYEELNETAVRVSWNPILPNPHWSTPVGYVIQIQSSSSTGAVTDVPVDGMSTTSYVVSLDSNMFYTFQVAARSRSGELGQLSAPYFFASSHTFSKTNAAKQSDQVDARQHKPFFSKSYRDGILIGMVLAVGLLTLCFGGICAHLRLKRRKLQMGLNANVASNLASASRSSNYEMEELMIRQRSDLGDAEMSTRNASCERMYRPARSSLSCGMEAPFLDTKGGEQGALPSGHDKYVRLLSDKRQMRRFKETGLLNVLTEGFSAKRHISCRKKTTDLNQRNELAVSSERPRHQLLDSKWIRAACGTSELWTGSLPLKNRSCDVDSLTARPLRARYLYASRTSANSNENNVVMPCFLSRLAAFSDRTTSQMKTLNQANSFSNICVRSTLVHSSNHQQNGLIRQQQSKGRKSSPVSADKTQYSCNSTSNRSLACSVAGSAENCKGPARKTVEIYSSTTVAPSAAAAVCSSVPNLADSGIVYDEMHSAPADHLGS